MNNANETPDHPDTDKRLIDTWLHSLSESTQLGYKRCANEFLLWVKKPLSAVTLTDLEGWVETFTDIAPHTQRFKMAAVKSLLSKGRTIGLLDKNVSHGLGNPKIKDTLNERILSEQEVTAMIQSQTNNKRNQAILLLLYTAGLRVNELCSLCWKDLSQRMPGGQLTIFGKGGKSRIILLPDSVWHHVSELRNNASADDPVFISRQKDSFGTALDQSQVNRIVALAATAAGINKKVSPHWLRHAHAIHSLNRGAPLDLVQKTVGHSSIATTSRYLNAHLDDSSALYLDVLSTTTKQSTQQSTNGNQQKLDKQKQPPTQVEKNTIVLKCPNCKSKEIQQCGFQILADGLNHQRFRCLRCDYAFTPLLSIPTDRM
ncbi:MAG: tyrosine-type recombinase/integrase [Rhizonema sp. NSF051]|nr:tyrosine-type recombinase/integrase [Rhizonema sp. NSF051]